MSIDEYINLVLKKIVSFYNPQMVYLFGSQARNDANENSDLDFLIIEETDKPKRLRALEFRKELRGQNYYPVDILVYTPQEFRNECQIKGTMSYHIKEEGKILYEQKNTVVS